MKKKGIGFYFKRIDEIMSMAANAHLKKYDITCSQANILFYKGQECCNAKGD